MKKYCKIYLNQQHRIVPQYISYGALIKINDDSTKVAPSQEGHFEYTLLYAV